MSVTRTIDTLWQEFRKAVDATYKGAKSNDDAAALKDYAQDVSWHDDMAKLLGRETANERQHRRNESPIKDFSTGTAAKLILMNQASFGAGLSQMPPATLFLTARDTAAMAEVIGWLCREHITQEWRAAVAALDYAALMRGGRQ